MPKFRAYISERFGMVLVKRICFDPPFIDFEWENEIGITQVYSEDLDKVELMQYTGLKDKNGVEIYEGDVLYHPLQGARKVFYPYSDRVASYGVREISTGLGSTLREAQAVWQVIGNIYQNPELLEVTE